MVLDKTFFEPLKHDPAEFDGEEGRAYNVGPDALLVNFKSIAITFVPDPVSKVARVIVVPEVAGLKVPATVPAIEGGCGDWRGRLQADINDPMNIRLRGVYPIACGERAIYLGALEHTNYFAAVFRALWERQGGTWTGKVRDGVVPTAARLIAVQDSPPLAMLIRDINKFSNNVMTQQLFLTMGAANGEPGNPARGGAAIRNLLSARGLDMPELVLENGCGLSRIERISAGFHGQPAGRCLEEPVDGGADGFSADLRRGRHHEGAQCADRRRPHEDRPARGHACGGRLCSGGQRQAIRGGGHHQPPECKPRNWGPRRTNRVGLQGGIRRACPYNSAPCQSLHHVCRSRYSRASLAPEKPRS